MTRLLALTHSSYSRWRIGERFCESVFNQHAIANANPRLKSALHVADKSVTGVFAREVKISDSILEDRAAAHDFLSLHLR